MQRLFPDSQGIASRFGRAFHNSFVLSLCILIAIQPALVEVARAQDIIIDPSGNVGTVPTLRPATGPAVVDIAKPNTGGVSHNKYSKFDVPSQGIVLNNSTGAAQTMLAGTISGNLNLGGVPAATILNEVTGTVASGLAGTVEVAGTRANVIIANPNGIACSGCSFVNAGSATLSTGMPVVDGNTVRLEVTGGTVAIGRGGLDGAATGLPAVNLVGRFVVIDGKVTAVTSIMAQSGAQRWDARINKPAGGLAPAAGDTVLDYGVDATAFGAMEAGRITIVGNEAGFGVRTAGAIAAGAGGISIVATDSITLRSAAAIGPVAITSTGGKVTVERDVSASADKVTISASGTAAVLAGAGVYGATGLAVTSGKGNVDLGGDLQSDTTISGASGKGVLTFSGYGYSGGAIALFGRSAVVLDGATVVANAFSATSDRGEVSLRDSALFTAQDVQVTTVAFHLGREVIIDGLGADDTTKLVVAASGAFRNEADMRLHSTAQITYAGALINEQSGIIEGDALVFASAQPITNSGILFGQTSLRIDTSRFTNTATGVVMGGGISITTTSDLLNSGLITATGDLRLTAATLVDTSGVMQAGRIYLSAPTIIARGASEIRGTSLIQVSATAKFTQQGTIGTPGSFAAVSPVFANTGQIIAETALAASGATTIANDGVLVSAKLVSLTASVSVINRGTISSYGQVVLASAGFVENRGTLVADTALSITGPRFSNLENAALVRAKTGSIATSAIVNSGRVFLVDGFRRSGDVDLFQNDGVFASEGNIDISGRDAASQAIIGASGVLISGLAADADTQTLIAGRGLSLNFNTLTFSGQIAAGGSIRIAGNEKQTLNGRIQTATDSIVLTSANLTLGAASVVHAGGQVRVDASVGLTNLGQIVTGARFELGSGFGYLNNSGGISIGTSTYRFAFAGSFTNTGVFAATGSISITAAQISSSGVMQAEGISLQSEGTLALAGAVISNAALTLRGTAITTADNTSIAATQLGITGTSFTNRGDIALSGASRNDWVLTAGYGQYGLLWSAGALRITAESAAVYAGSLLGTGSTLALTTTKDIAVSGKITAQSVTLSGAKLTSGADASIAVTDDLTITATGSATLAGEILTGKKLSVSAPAITISGKAFGATILLAATGNFVNAGEISATGAFNLTAGGSLTNSGRLETAGQLGLTGASVANTATGNVAATKLLVASTGAVTNLGKIFGAQDITLNAAAFSNAASATITAGSLGFDLTGGFTNRGSIDVYGLFGSAAGAAVNSGSIHTETYFGLTAASFSNETLGADKGVLISDGHVFLSLAGALTNRVGSEVRAQNMDLRAGSLTNEGTLQASDILTASSATGAMANSGFIRGKTIVLLAGAGFANSGVIGQVASAALPKAALVQLASGKLSTATKATLVNSGLIEAAEILLEGRDGLQNIAGGQTSYAVSGRIGATGSLGLSVLAGDLVNAGGLSAGQGLSASVSGSFNNSGAVQAGGQLWVAAGAIRNGSGASLAGSMVLLEAQAGGISNSGEVAAQAALGMRALAGDLLLEGIVSGTDITLIAQAGGISVLQNLASGGTLHVSGRTVSLAGKVSATHAVTLVSTAGNITTGGNITTKTLIIEAAGNLIAPGHTLRGTELTQVVANDIIRSDITATNRKLTVIHANTAMKDVFVSLRTGNLGIYGANDTDMSGYEAVNFNVSGSIALRSEGGGLFLAGTVIAADDLALYAKWGVGLRNATVTAGDILTIEAGYNIMNYGNLWFNAGNTVQLLQGNGWFYTADWLPKTPGYNLVVFAKTIIVNSSHRFAGKSVTFRAVDNIRQRDQVISAEKIAYAAGNNILVEFDGFDWRGANLGAVATGDWWDVQSAGLRSDTLLARSGGLSLVAGGDIHLISGKIYSSTTIELSALGNIISEPFYIENDEDSRPGYIGWDFTSAYRAVLPGHDPANVSLSELRAYENILTAEGNVSISAGGNIDLIGTRITSNAGNISIHSASGTITMAAAPGGWSYSYAQTTVRKSWFGLKKKVTTYSYDAYDDLYKPTWLVALNGTVSIVSTGLADPATGNSTIVSAGTQIAANDVFIATRAPDGSTGTPGSITLGTYAQEHSVNTATRSKSSFIGITYRSRTETTAKSALINIGNNLLADDILSLSSGMHLTIIGGRLSGKSVSISAIGNLNILAAIDSKRLEKFEERRNLVTITTIQSGFSRETAKLPKITSATPVQFAIGGKAHIAAAPGVNLNSQLLGIIGTRQFGLKLAPIMTAADAAASAAQAATISNDYMRDFMLPGASDGAQYAYLDTLMDQFGATYHQIALRDHSWYDKQVRLTPAFQALLSIATAYVTGGLGLNGWQQAAANSLISGSIEGAITGNFDGGLILRSTILAGVSSYISGAITSKFKLGKSLGLSDQSPFASDFRNNFAPAAIVNRAGDQVVNTVVSNLVNGNPAFQGLDKLGRTFLVTEAMGVVQFGIGELGAGKGKWEGSLPHLLLHGGLGCIAMEAMEGNCASGFFAGASQSVLAGSGLTDKQKEALAPLAGGLAGFLWADGQAVGVSFGSAIAEAGLKNNFLSHADEDFLRQEIEACMATADGCSEEDLYDIGEKLMARSRENIESLKGCETPECLWDHMQSVMSVAKIEAILRKAELPNAGAYAALLYSADLIGLTETDYMEVYARIRATEMNRLSQECYGQGSATSCTQLHALGADNAFGNPLVGLGMLLGLAPGGGAAAKKAVAPVGKFSDYIFKEGATHGKDVIFKGLGYSVGDSAKLAKMWEEQAAAKYAKGQYTIGKLDQYGQRINITIDLPGIGIASGKSSSLISGWMIRPDGSITLNTPFSGFPN